MSNHSNSNVPAIREVALHQIEGEPRAKDVDIADRLGFTRGRDIRPLIERHREALEQFGPISRYGAAKSGPGRKQEGFWLTEPQALYIGSKSDAPNAQAVLTMLIKVFMAWRRGELEAPAASQTQLHHSAREARLFMKHAMGLAKIGGLLGNQLLIAANRATRKAVGFDYLDAMGLSYLAAPDNDVLLNPTDIGKDLGAMTAFRVNHLLAENGYQTGQKDAKGRGYWLPTEKGIAAGGQMVDVERFNKTGQARQLRWPSSIVGVLRQIIEEAA